MGKKSILGQKPGNAGTIVVILIFGFLMTISTAYIKMVQTESEVQTMMDQTERAVDAAFSGINYAISVAQTKKEMFENDAAKARMRLYLVGPTTNWNTTSMGITFNSTNFPNATNTGPLFLNEAMPLFDIEETATRTYSFRAHSYPGVTAPGMANIAPGSFTIKAQGYYRVFAPDKTTVLATYSAQLIAQCEINFKQKIIQLKRFRHMPFEPNNAAFFTATDY